MDQSAVAAILILHRTANRVVAKIGGRTPSQSSTLTPAVSRTAFQRANSRPMCWPLTGLRADRTLTARHVGVAPLPVKNRPETGKPSWRSFPTAAGWFFAPALPLGLPKCAARPRPDAEEHRNANGCTNAATA